MSSSPEQEDLFRCNVCNKYFRTRNSCPDHGNLCGKDSKISQKPSKSDTNQTNNVHCGEDGCEQNFKTISNLRLHLKNDHNIAFHEENLLFNSRKDFLLWKEQAEVEHNSRFVRTSGEKKNGSNWVQYWQCSRSVKFLAKSNKFCTAGIVSKRAESGVVSVYLCTTHYGHLEDDSPPPTKKVRKSRKNTGIAFEEEIESGVRSILFKESEGTIAPGDWPQGTAKPNKLNASKKIDSRVELRKQRTSTKTLLSQIGQLVEMVDDAKAFAQSRSLLIQAWKVLAKCKMSGQSPARKRVAEATQILSNDADAIQQCQVDVDAETAAKCSNLHNLQDVIQLQEIEIEGDVEHGQITETQDGHFQVTHIQEIQIHDLAVVHAESGDIQHAEFTLATHEC